MTTYLLVRWKHSNPDEPLVLYSELDEDRMQRRKINADPEHEAEEIDEAEFERLWAVRRNARIMTSFALENDGGGSS